MAINGFGNNYNYNNYKYNRQIQQNNINKQNGIQNHNSLGNINSDEQAKTSGIIGDIIDTIVDTAMQYAPSTPKTDEDKAYYWGDRSTGSTIDGGAYATIGLFYTIRNWWNNRNNS